MRKFICSLLALLVLFSFTGCSPTLYKDTNGNADLSLQTLTDADIIGKTGSSSFMSSTVRRSDGTVRKVRTMSGVEKLFELNMDNETLDLVVSCKITKGNARLVLVINDEIVHDFPLNGTSQRFTLENVTGSVSLRLAGESAGYSVQYQLQ